MLLLLLATAPPPRGAMMLLPLRAADRGMMLAMAVNHGARLIGQGPVAGSFIVRADRDAILPTMLAHGILTLSAIDTGCGAKRHD